MACITYQSVLLGSPGTERGNIGNLLLEQSGNPVLKIGLYGIKNAYIDLG